MKTITSVNKEVRNVLKKVIANKYADVIAEVEKDENAKLKSLKITSKKTSGGVDNSGNSYLFFAELEFVEEDGTAFNAKENILKISDHAKGINRKGSNLQYDHINSEYLSLSELTKKVEANIDFAISELY